MQLDYSSASQLVLFQDSDFTLEMRGPNIKVLKYCLAYKSKSVVKIILKLINIKLITMTGIV